MVTLELSPVARATEPLPETPAAEALLRLTGAPVEACGADGECLVAAEQNPMFVAAHRAFAEHRPLVLTPDVVWLCVAQGFAEHVNQQAEQLRGRFVRHEGRARLQVRRDDFVAGSPDNPWPEVFAEFSQQIAGFIGKQRDLVVCDFSTTGPIARAASEVVLMDTFQQYFTYELYTLCGIPEIRLAGTVDDWRSVRQRVQMLAEYGLEWWTSALAPVLDEFVAAASSSAELPFWECFFKSPHRSGSAVVSGWINLLFPYGVDGGGKRVRNPYVDRFRLTCQRYDGTLAEHVERIGDDGIKVDSLPLGLARAPMRWNYLGDVIDMELLGGFVGVAQAADLALRPAIGWAVRPKGPATIHREPDKGRICAP